MSFYGYIQEKNSTLILTLSYYLSKVFVIIEKNSQALTNVLQTVQNHINSINIYESDSMMTCCTRILSVANALKNSYVGGPLWDKFTSEYYNVNNYAFVPLFKQYTASNVDNIDHPCTVIEWKDSMDKEYYQ